MIKIIFAGTPDFAVPCLAALCEMDNVEVVAVYTQPDRPKGRGQQLQPSPVKSFASTHELPIFQPESLRDAESLAALQSIEADVMVVVAYGQILSEAALAVPRVACVNVHASLLPRWRGAAPIQRAIEAGDAETGVCLMQMEKGLDTGPVYARRTISITDKMTTPDLHDALANIGGDMLREHLDEIVSGECLPEVQSSEGITYAEKLVKSDGEVDWSRSAREIHNQIRALQPWPVAQTQFQGKALRLWRAEECSIDSTQAAGEIIAVDKSGFSIACGEGALHVLEVQLAGKSRMSADAFARSRDIIGEKLG